MLSNMPKLQKFLAAIFGLAIIILVIVNPAPTNLPIISFVLCVISFGYIVYTSIAAGNKSQKQLSIFEKIETRKKEIRQDLDKARDSATLLPATMETLAKEVHRLEAPMQREIPEDNPLIVGIGAIYGLVNSLGISEALTGYFKSLSVNHALQFSLLGIVTLDIPYTFRLLGFFATIIPFIHGFILMLTIKWYHNPVKDTYHLRVAFFFFISVFIHTVLFYLLAVNLDDISLYLLLLWTIMLVNTTWLVIESATTRYILDRTETFLIEWIFLNFNTAAFLSVFIFAYPPILQHHTSVTGDININILIALVLIFRTVVDYIVGWRKVYNKNY
jgi:hypothetical protein